MDLTKLPIYEDRDFSKEKVGDKFQLKNMLIQKQIDCLIEVGYTVGMVFYMEKISENKWKMKGNGIDIKIND